MARVKNPTKPHKLRGKRLAEICEKILPQEKSRAARCRVLGLSESTFRNWEKGADIDNDALASIAEHGGDVQYILTGRPSEAGAERELQSVYFGFVQSLNRAQAAAMGNPTFRPTWRDQLESMQDIVEHILRRAEQGASSPGPASQSQPAG